MYTQRLTTLNLFDMYKNELDISFLQTKYVRTLFLYNLYVHLRSKDKIKISWYDLAIQSWPYFKTPIILSP